MPQDIDGSDAQGWFARKRSTLAAALVMTAPGIPMLFQGQEFLEGEWFRSGARSTALALAENLAKRGMSALSRHRFPINLREE